MENMKALWMRLCLAMRHRVQHERDALPWVFLALCCVLLPNLALAFWPNWDKDGLWDFFHLLCLALLPCFVGLSVRKLLWFLWPLVCVGPAVLACRVVTGELPSEWLFLVIAETNPREASAFAPQIVATVLADVMLASAYGWIVWRKIPVGFRPGPLCAGLVVVCVLLYPLTEMFDYGAREEGRMEMGRLTAGYPGGTIKAFLTAAGLRRQMSERGEQCDNVVVKSTEPPLPAGQREIHMLVLGESTRASSLQLNGYERETTPLLAKMPGLLNFKDVIAPAPATVLSVPILLTPTNAATVRNAGLLPSILNVFKAAGYRVYWLSTQPKHGLWDTSNSILALDANRTYFLSAKLPRHDTTDYQTALDSDMIPVVREILARGEPKVLFVLHTMGSHLVYADRYPPEFNRFPADLNVCKHARDHTLPADVVNLNMRNSYDNTIVFIDWVLSQLIEVLTKEHSVTSLYYVSDHGENGAESAVLPWGHGNLTTAVLHVPMILWLSPEYQAARPRQFQALRSHVNLPLSSDNTFHTYLDIAGLTCPLTQLDHSIASPSFHQGPRIVTHLHDGLADYDKEILPMEGKRGGWRPLKNRKPQLIVPPDTK